MKSPTAYIEVTCDQCNKYTEKVELTTTARGYDERDVDEELIAFGWLLEDGKDICPECAEELAETETTA